MRQEPQLDMACALSSCLLKVRENAKKMRAPQESLSSGFESWAAVLICDRVSLASYLSLAESTIKQLNGGYAEERKASHSLTG